MTTPTPTWTETALQYLSRMLTRNEGAIAQASAWCAESLVADGLVHTFGSGHSRIPVEEFFPRYGSYPGFHPIVELSTSFHTQVVGANGQRQAMFIERVPGLAEQVLANYSFAPQDLLVCFSVSGQSALPVELLRGFGERGLRTIAVTSAHPDNALAQAADLVIDLMIDGPDAIVSVPGVEHPVGPVSSFLYVAVVNEIKVRTAALLAERGAPPLVLVGARDVGAEASRAAFDAAYAEHARRASTRLAGS